MHRVAGILICSLALGSSCKTNQSAVDGALPGVDGAGASDSGTPRVSDAHSEDGGRSDNEDGDRADSEPRNELDASADARSGDAEADPADASMMDATADSSPDEAGLQERPLRSFVYVGGVSSGDAPYPFRAYALDRETLTLSELLGTPTMGHNPTYIMPSHDGLHLYIADEYGDGGVTVASVDPLTGALANLDFAVGSGGGFVFTEVSPNGD